MRWKKIGKKDTYLDRVYGVALDVEFGVQNDLQKALNLGQIKPTWKQGGVLGENAQVFTDEWDVVCVGVLVQECIDELGALVLQNHREFIIAPVWPDQFKNNRLQLFPVFELKQIDVFNEAYESLPVLNTRLDHLGDCNRVKGFVHILAINYVGNAFEVLSKLGLLCCRSQNCIWTTTGGWRLLLHLL